MRGLFLYSFLFTLSSICISSSQAYAQNAVIEGCMETCVIEGNVEDCSKICECVFLYMSHSWPSHKDYMFVPVQHPALFAEVSNDAAYYCAAEYLPDLQHSDFLKTCLVSRKGYKRFFAANWCACAEDELIRFGLLESFMSTQAVRSNVETFRAELKSLRDTYDGLSFRLRKCSSGRWAFDRREMEAEVGGRVSIPAIPPQPKADTVPNEGGATSTGQSDEKASSTPRTREGIDEAAEAERRKQQQEAARSTQEATIAARKKEAAGLSASIQESWANCMAGDYVEQLNCLNSACPEIRQRLAQLEELDSTVVLLIDCDSRIAQLQAAIQRDLARQDAISANKKRLERAGQQSNQAETEAYSETQKKVSMAQCMGGDKEACSVLDKASLEKVCRTMGPTSTSYPPCENTTGQ